MAYITIVESLLDNAEVNKLNPSRSWIRIVPHSSLLSFKLILNIILIF